MSDRIAWVTGAGGEIGQALIPRLVDEGYKVLALDLKPLPQYDKGPVDTLIGDILETEPLKDAMERLPPTRIFHLAALLSSRSEQQPYLAHRINVNGSIQLLELAEASALKRNRMLRFFFPSSIAAYGIPDATAKK